MEVEKVLIRRPEEGITTTVYVSLFNNIPPEALRKD